MTEATETNNLFQLEWFRKKEKTPFDRLINVLDKGPLPFSLIVIDTDTGEKAIMSRMGQPTKDDLPTYAISISLKEEKDKKTVFVATRLLSPGVLLPTMFSCEKFPEFHTDEAKTFEKIKETLAAAEQKLKTLKEEQEKQCPVL